MPAPSGLRSPQRVLLRRLLKETREYAGITQVQLAAKLKRPQSYVSKVETGERRSDLVEIREIALACNSSLTAFVSRYEKLLAEKQGRH